MKELKLLLILPLSVSSESNLPFCVLLIDAILELNEPIELDTEELNVFVVVATDEDKEPILELKPLVVVATELDKLKILELSTNVVVATDDDKEPIDELIDPLNVEYPVVPVIII